MTAQLCREVCKEHAPACYNICCSTSSLFLLPTCTSLHRYVGKRSDVERGCGGWLKSTTVSRVSSRMTKQRPFDGGNFSQEYHDTTVIDADTVWSVYDDALGAFRTDTTIKTSVVQCLPVAWKPSFPRATSNSPKADNGMAGTPKCRETLQRSISCTQQTNEKHHVFDASANCQTNTIPTTDDVLHWLTLPREHWLTQASQVQIVCSSTTSLHSDIAGTYRRVQNKANSSSGQVFAQVLMDVNEQRVLQSREFTPNATPTRFKLDSPGNGKGDVFFYLATALQGEGRWFVGSEASVLRGHGGWLRSSASCPQLVQSSLASYLECFNSENDTGVAMHSDVTMDTVARAHCTDRIEIDTAGMCLENQRTTYRGPEGPLAADSGQQLGTWVVDDTLNVHVTREPCHEGAESDKGDEFIVGYGWSTNGQEKESKKDFSKAESSVSPSVTDHQMKYVLRFEGMRSIHGDVMHQKFVLNTGGWFEPRATLQEEVDQDKRERHRKSRLYFSQAHKIWYVGDEQDFEFGYGGRIRLQSSDSKFESLTSTAIQWERFDTVADRWNKDSALCCKIEAASPLSSDDISCGNSSAVCV